MLSRTLPQSVPKYAFKGATLEFRRKFDDMTPGTDTATLYLRSSTGRLDIAATEDNGFFKFHTSDLDADDGYLLGDTEFVIIVAQGSDEIPVERGTIHIEPDPTESESVDLRSDNKIILDAIVATLKGNASVDQLSYTISTSAGTRSLSRVPRGELMDLEREYRARVRGENRRKLGRSGKRRGNVVKSRMSRRG